MRRDRTPETAVGEYTDTSASVNTAKLVLTRPERCIYGLASAASVLNVAAFEQNRCAGAGLQEQPTVNHTNTSGCANTAKLVLTLPEKGICEFGLNRIGFGVWNGLECRFL